MLDIPQRSVTRFFIPMIDVLTLLFCIYLLMPMVSNSGEAESDADRQLREDRLRLLESELRRLGQGGEEVPARLREEIEKLRKDKGKALENRLAVRVMEIDPTNGKLSFRDPGRVEIRNQADAHELIERDRREQGVAHRELYYLILYPRDRGSAYPTRDQREKYDRWFADVALGYDVPGRAPGHERPAASRGDKKQ